MTVGVWMASEGIWDIFALVLLELAAQACLHAAGQIFRNQVLIMNHIQAAGELHTGWGRGIGRYWRQLRGRIPSVCPLCEQSSQGGLLCRYCCAYLQRSPQAACVACGLDLSRLSVCPDCLATDFVLEQTVCAFDYVFSGELLIHRLKIQHRQELLAALAHFLYQCWLQAAIPMRGQLGWIAVPARKEAIRKRGFSPPAGLARQLRYLSGAPDLSRYVAWRQEPTEQQKRLSRQARLMAMQQAWYCRSDLSGRSVVLVDDVMTTGATLDSLARVCLQAGAEQVFALVLARTPYRVRAVTA